MRCEESENIFQLYHAQSHPLSIANWCDSLTVKEPPQRTMQGKTARPKISIKRFQNRTAGQKTVHSDKSLPLSANLTTILRPTPPLPTQQLISIPKLQFTYRNQQRLPPNDSHIDRNSVSSKTIKIVEHLTEQHDISMEINECPESVAQVSDDLRRTKKKLGPCSIEGHEQQEIVSTAAQGDRNEYLYDEAKRKQRGQKALIKSQEIFTKPKTAFERGNLFKAVRRSQTILNDYKSDSEESQVLEDYKSLMSKIKEHKLEEQFQQI